MLKGIAVFGLLLLALPAAAQTPAPAPRVVFLPRADVSFLWGSFVSDDPRFEWDGVLAADLDLMSYPRGRLNFYADYEAVLGDQSRPFEINHENFALDGSGSRDYQWGTLSVAFHHVSRHLSDRPNPNIIAWNVLDTRASRRFRAGRSDIDGELAFGKVLQHTFVDYVWTADLRIRLQRPIAERVALVAAGVGHLIGVDEAKYGRERQCGAKLEAGIRLRGRAAALELIAGYERRIDGFPTELTRMRAFTFGLRITSK